MQPRVHVVLMQDCPYKWSDKIFKEKDIFCMEKVVGWALDLPTKSFFTLDKYWL